MTRVDTRVETLLRRRSRDALRKYGAGTRLAKHRSMKIKSNVRAGALTANHSASGLKIKSKVRAGALT